MKWVRWVTAAFVVLLVVIVWVANRGLGPAVFGPVYRFPGGDKVGHFLLMGLFSFLVNLSLGGRRARLGPLSLLVGSVVVAGIVTAEEFSQLLFRSRTFSLEDLACDYLGIVLFGQAAAYVVRSARSLETQENPDTVVEQAGL